MQVREGILDQVVWRSSATSTKMQSWDRQKQFVIISIISMTITKIINMIIL